MDTAKGKGKGKTPPPPPSNGGKGKGKGEGVLTMNSVAPSLSRMVLLSVNGDAIEGITMSGNVLFSFPATFIENSTTIRVIRRKIEELVVGDAFKARVQLLRNGVPMADDDIVTDLNGLVVKWSRGWDKVHTEDELAAQNQTEMRAIGLPIETEGRTMEECRDNLLQWLNAKWEEERRTFEEEREEWEEGIKAWEQQVKDWEEEQARRAALLEEWKAKGEMKGKGTIPPIPPKGKGKAKGKGSCYPQPPAPPLPVADEPPKAVTGFSISKGVPGKEWACVETAQIDENLIPAIALPIDTDFLDFQNVRQAYIEFLLCRSCIDYEEWRSRESFDPVCAENCRKVRETIRLIPIGGPKAKLHIPQPKSVDILETVRTHLGPARNKTSRIDCRTDEEITVAAFGFCVDINLHGTELCNLLELVKMGDHESVAQHPHAGSQFQAEAARLGVHLKDVLQFLEARVLDELGRLSYPIYPAQIPDYVEPAAIDRNVVVVFIVGSCSLPQSSNDIPSTTDLCKVAINPRSFNEHKRLALEALAIKVADQDSQLSENDKKGLATISCLLATHSDAAVREQAQELMVAAITPENLNFVKNFFSSHRYLLGNRIVQDICTVCNSTAATIEA